MHNHYSPPSDWRITPYTKGFSLKLQPLEKSIAAANLERVRAVVNKSKKDVCKVDNDTFKIVSSFPSIKERKCAAIFRSRCHR